MLRFFYLTGGFSNDIINFFVSKKSFVGKSNGLYTYYVCECGKKTTPINGKGKMLDLYGLVKRVLKT